MSQARKYRWYPACQRQQGVMQRSEQDLSQSRVDFRMTSNVKKIGWSVKSVGGRRLGELAKCMIERDFRGSEGSEAVRFSHGDFGFVVQPLDDAAGELFSCTEVVEDQFAVCAYRAGELLHRLDT